MSIEHYCLESPVSITSITTDYELLQMVAVRHMMVI